MNCLHYCWTLAQTYLILFKARLYKFVNLKAMLCFFFRPRPETAKEAEIQTLVSIPAPQCFALWMLDIFVSF